HDDGPVERQPLTPGAHEHDLADLALALEAPPHRTRRRIVFFFLREGPINADDGVLPNLPPVTLKDAPFVRPRHLLQPSAREGRAEFSFDARDFPRAKPLRPHQRAFALFDLAFL